MVVKIKSPNLDDVWDRWKKKSAKSQKLEKHYGVKGASFNLDNITAAEFVTGVTKGAIIYLEKSYSVKGGSAGKGKKQSGTAKDVEREKFYQFASSPVKSEWKGPKEVSMFQSLQAQNCPKCGGKSGLTCTKCKGVGSIACPDCGGKALTCKHCKGGGKEEIMITVINERGDKNRVPKTVNCSRCFGSGKMVCGRCGGIGKVPCKSCNGMGLDECPTCRGAGRTFEYAVSPVPFKSVSNSKPILLTSGKIGGLEKELGADMADIIQKVEAIMIRNPEKELNPKGIEPNLGFMDKPIQKIIKVAQKEWKDASKKEDLSIGVPIYLFPVQILDCVTRKGKKFQVVSLGSDKRFMVVGRI